MTRTFDFGTALRLLKDGHRVARQGWNGKGMWLALIRGRHVQVHHNGFGPINEHDHEWRDRVPRLLDWIGMKTADNGFVPWLASQTDMLAEDWVDLDPSEKLITERWPWKEVQLSRQPTPGWESDPFPPPPGSDTTNLIPGRTVLVNHDEGSRNIDLGPLPPTPPPRPTVDEVIAKAVQNLLDLSASGALGHTPSKPVDVLVSVCSKRLATFAIEEPDDLRQRCNDVLLNALMKG